MIELPIILVACVVAVCCAMGTAFTMILFARAISLAASAFVHLVQAASVYRTELLEASWPHAKADEANAQHQETIAPDPIIYDDDELMAAVRAGKPNKDDAVRTADENAGFEERDMEPVGGTRLFNGR